MVASIYLLFIIWRMNYAMESTPQNRLEQIRHRLLSAASTAMRAPTSVRLIAVSKGHPAASVEALMACGQMCFGENRVQEATTKFGAMHQRNQLELHLIGPLQTNKARQAVELFDVIETLDRPELAQALHKAMAATGKRPRLLVQVNTGLEPQKTGVTPDGLAGLLALSHQLDLPVTGLMCIPPAGEDPAPHFRQLTSLASQHSLPELSMGMSGDFESAIACGATYIRVGTALFGERSKP